MKTIWKYELEMTDKQILRVPNGSKAIHVGMDPSGNECIWFEVETGNTEFDRAVYVLGSGMDIPVGVSHVGSMVQEWMVWHIYC